MDQKLCTDLDLVFAPLREGKARQPGRGERAGREERDEVPANAAEAAWECREGAETRHGGGGGRDERGEAGAGVLSGLLGAGLSLREGLYSARVFFHTGATICCPTCR